MRLAWLLLLAFAAQGAPTFSADHQQAVNRRRRVVVQLDAADHRRTDVTPEQWLKEVFTFPDEPGSQIDSIILDIGLDGESAVYPSRVLPFTDDRRINQWRDQGFEWVGALVRECRKRHIEVLWNHRFSEVDINRDGALEMATLHPLKAAHPDWLIRSWWWQGLWNAAVPEVRRMKLEILRELVESYLLDGVQIDFARHVPCLPPGHQWENRAGATAFVSMVRTMLLEQERRRNRPLLLSVKVPQTIEGARMDGFDVATWAKDGLVDLMTLGSRSLEVDIEDYRRAAGGAPVKLMPCFDDHHTSDGYRSAPIEVLRGVFATWWHQGADSVTTFNWAVTPAESKTHQRAYHEIGVPELMRKSDKVFVVERRGGYPWAEGFFNRNDTAPLPAILSNSGEASSFHIRLADSDPPRSAVLRLVLFRAGAGDRFEVALNGQTLAEIRRDPLWKDPQIFSPKPQPNSGGSGIYKIDPVQKLLLIEYRIDPRHVTPGRSTVSIRILSREPFPPAVYVQLEKVEIRCEQVAPLPSRL